MILFGRYLSPFTRRVAVSLKILDLPFERKVITAWNDLEELRLLNPVGRVPVLMIDKGEILFDSGAILDDIDCMVGPDRALLPTGRADRRETLRVVSVALGVMDKAAAARYERVMRPADKVHQPWIDHNIGQVISGLDWLNTRFSSLPRKSELSQDVISTVVAYDFLHFCMAEVVDLTRYNALRNLASECSVHPSFHETRPEIDFGLPPLSDPV